MGNSDNRNAAELAQEQEELAGRLRYLLCVNRNLSLAFQFFRTFEAIFECMEFT